MNNNEDILAKAYLTNKNHISVIQNELKSYTGTGSNTALMSLADDNTIVLHVTPINPYLNPQTYAMYRKYATYTPREFKLDYKAGNGQYSTGLIGASIVQPTAESVALDTTDAISLILQS